MSELDMPLSVTNPEEQDPCQVILGCSVEGDNFYVYSSSEIFMSSNPVDDGEFDDELDPEFEKEIDSFVSDPGRWRISSGY